MRHGRQFTIGQWAVTAIVYGDTSGLEQDEIDKLNQFESDVEGYLVLMDDGEQPSFQRCDITGLWDDCYQFVELIQD